MLVPSATRVECTDTGADDVLRRLAALLPDAWIVAGPVGSKPVSDICCRGHTRPFDAVIIGDRIIFVLDIWSHSVRMANPQKSGLFARLHDASRAQDDFWRDFRRDTEKLKATLHDRFEIEPGRVVPEKFGTATDNAELRSFARAATRYDRAAMFAPLSSKAVDRVATFLTEEPTEAPKPTELFFTDGAKPTVVARAPATREMPVPAASPGTTPPASAARSKAAVAAPPSPSPTIQADVPFPSPPPTSVPIAAPSRAVVAKQPVVAKAAQAAAAAPVEPSSPGRTEAPPPSAAEPAVTKERPTEPLILDVVEPAAARPTGGNSSAEQATPKAQAPIALPKELPRPSPAREPAPARAVARVTEDPATADATDADPALGQRLRPVAFAPAALRSIGRWQMLAALLVLLLVSQAGTIAWLALVDHDNQPAEPAPPAVRAAAPAVPVPSAPMPAQYVVRSLATSEPMVIGSEMVILRAGPSPDFPSVGELDAGSEVVASGSAGGPGGSSWIEIAAADGTVGFVPDSMVQPVPAPAVALEDVQAPKEMPPPRIEPVAAPKVKQAVIERAAIRERPPTPKVKRAVASKRTPPLRIARASAPPQTPRPKAAAPPPITCILPGGGEILATRPDCRAQSGIIYQ